MQESQGQKLGNFEHRNRGWLKLIRDLLNYVQKVQQQYGKAVHKPKRVESYFEDKTRNIQTFEAINFKY